MVEAFLNYIEAERRYSPLTVANYRRDIERFVRWCEEDIIPPLRPFDPRKITGQLVREWMLRRTEQDGVSASSMNRELSSLKSFFRYLHRTGRVGGDIFRFVVSLRTPRRLPTFVPESRMKEILKSCGEEELSDDFRSVRNALIVELFYGCGLRLAELVGMNRQDLSDDLQTLRVYGKGGKVRMVPLVEALREKIIGYMAYIDRQNICKTGEKALILNRKGERISRSTVYRTVKSELERGGVQGKRSPHVLRHTFATHLLDHGADMRDIQELMGHASLQATQVYTHNSIAQLKKVYAAAHPREGGAKSRKK